LFRSDDPRDLSRMTYSDNQFRHKVVFYGTVPSIWGISMGLRYSGIAGTRYSLSVKGNVNGDFVASNDLAFVYNPDDNNVPQNLREGIQKILDNPNAEQSIKDYIRNNAGRIAERNGGVNGFYGVFDLHLAKEFKFYKTHGIEASVDIFNVANLFNKDWGVGNNLGKQELYSIKSFDAQKLQYLYNMTSNVGVSTLNGNPFQVQLGLRYSFKEFKFYKTHGIEASVDIFNVANLFNKDWGVGNNLGKQELYSIKSFDAQKLQYLYNMTSNVGVSTLNGNPFQVQLGLRYSF